MKENKYDDQFFFDKYRRMPRSVEGLSAAGEWHAFRGMLPSMGQKRVLDLGCGFGWHCRYAAENGAASVLGIDISENMLAEARRLTNSPLIEYRLDSIEDTVLTEESFDVVISSLALHYLTSFATVCDKIAKALTKGGDFVFSVEHPIFTAFGTQDWHRDESGNRLHWPVDRYFFEGRRDATFLDVKVSKYHTTLTTYIQGLLNAGFIITGLVEPRPDPALLDTIPGMRDELRRPMMLLISAKKPSEAPR